MVAIAGGRLTEDAVQSMRTTVPQTLPFPAPSQAMPSTHRYETAEATSHTVQTPARAGHALLKGQVVTITGLVNAVHLKGAKGTFSEWLPATSRWEVKLEGGEI